MQTSQNLKAIQYILESNKEKELKFNKETKLIVNDKMNYKYHSVIKAKYEGIINLDGLSMYNYLEGYIKGITKIIYEIFNINLYKDTWFSRNFWDTVNEGIIIKTIFKINNSNVFISSLLELIDNEKENLHIYKKEEQNKNIYNLINKSKEKFSSEKFPLSIKIKDYILSHNQYYKTLKLVENQYTIVDIQIYQGKITFTLSENKNKETLIVFKDNDLYIDGKEVFFQRKNTVIFEIIKLLFSYFDNNITNYVEFDNLEKYYKNHKEIYPNLEKSRFDYEYLRKSIETKTKEIEEKHNLNKTFLGINTSGIKCHYLKPENK